MSGDVTQQALARLSYLPERDGEDNGVMIAGQKYFDVYFTGGQADNLELNSPTINTPSFPTPLELSQGGTGSNLTDPGADRGLFWDESESKVDWLIFGAGLSVVDKTITVSGVGLGDVTGPMSSTDEAIARYNGTTGKIIQSSGAFIDDSGNLTANNFSGSSSGTNTGDQTNITGNAETVTTINGRLANGTGTTLSGSGTSGSPYTVGVNTSQNIATLSNLTSNGFVTTSSGNGTLSVTAGTGSGSVVRDTGATFSGATITTSSINGVTPTTAGSAGQFLNGAGSYADRVVAGTSQTATGTAIDFTSIPSWVKTITISFAGVSTNGTSNMLFQLGDSGGVENSGYLGTGASQSGGGSTYTNFTAGFGVPDIVAAGVYHGSVVLTLISAAAFTWAASGQLGTSNAGGIYTITGSKSLSATLDRVRITMANGTDTFDAGVINILYQ